MAKKCVKCGEILELLDGVVVPDGEDCCVNCGSKQFEETSDRPAKAEKKTKKK